MLTLSVHIIRFPCESYHVMTYVILYVMPYVMSLRHFTRHFIRHFIRHVIPYVIPYVHSQRILSHTVYSFGVRDSWEIIQYLEWCKGEPNK